MAPARTTRSDRIAAFYDAHRDGLYGYALSLTGCRAAAEDAVQTAICRILNRPVLPRSLKPFAYRCVRNAAVDEWRKNDARRDCLFDLDALPVPGVSEAGARVLEDLLYRLSEKQREIIVLKVMQGMTFREIAAIRRESIHTVASRYRRGIQTMRDQLQEDEP